MTRYSSISSRKLSKALTILTADKCMVAMSDYNDFHKLVKRYILANVLGANAQVFVFKIVLVLVLVLFFGLISNSLICFKFRKDSDKGETP